MVSSARTAEIRVKIRKSVTYHQVRERAALWAAQKSKAIGHLGDQNVTFTDFLASGSSTVYKSAA